jgi:hypothetical protein
LVIKREAQWNEFSNLCALPFASLRLGKLFSARHNQFFHPACSAAMRSKSLLVKDERSMERGNLMDPLLLQDSLTPAPRVELWRTEAWRNEQTQLRSGAM